MKEKYVVILKGDTESIFTFPEEVQHDRMFEAIGAIRTGSDQDWRRDYRLVKAVSAGFVANGQCYGESETLKLKSRGAIDTALLARGSGNMAATAPTAPAGRDEAVESLSADQIEQLRMALSWMGESTYETHEECAINQGNLMRRLITAVLAHRDGLMDAAEESTLSSAAQLLRQIVTGDVGKQTLRTLSEGQGTATCDGKVWLAAKALVDEQAKKPDAGEAQRVWVVDDDRGEHVMMCPQAPLPDHMDELAAKIERNVIVRAFFLTPVSEVPDPDAPAQQERAILTTDQIVEIGTKHEFLDHETGKTDFDRLGFALEIARLAEKRSRMGVVNSAS